MKRFLLAIGILAACATSVLGQGTPNSATVVSACGTPPSTYTAGQNKPALQDTNGRQCTDNSGTVVTGTVTANQGAAGSTPWPTVDKTGTTFAPAIVALSTSATLVLASGSYVSRQVCNADTGILIYIGAAGVTTSTGIKLQPSACWDASHSTAAIYAVAASATPNAAAVQY